MTLCKRNKEKFAYFLPKFICYGFIGLLSVVLLSESVGARDAVAQLQIAQQPTTQANATRAEAEKLTKQGMQLYQQGSAESLVAARKKWETALVLWQKLGDKSGQAFALLFIGRVYDSLGDKQQALKFYNQSLPLSIEVGDKSLQAATLNNIGLVYDSLGDKQQALKFYNQSLPLTIEVGDKSGQARTLNNIGGVYSSLGDKQQALKFYNQSLPLSIEVGDKSLQARTLNNIGSVYSSLGDKQQALKFYNQSLPLSIQVGDKSLQAATLNNIGFVYDDLGDKQQALKFYNQSLPLRIEVGDKSGQARTLNNIGGVYDDLGDKQQALKFYNQSLPLSIEVGDKSQQAATLNNIGGVYDDLGDKQQALKFYNQSLPLSIEVGDKSQQAATLNNIGGVYDDLGDKQQALKFYNQSLPLSIEVGDKSQQATTLNNIGGVYDDLGDKQQALKFYNQSLPLRIEVGDKSGQAATLNNIGGVYDDLGDKQQALKFYNQSLPLRIEVGDKSGQARTLNNIGRVYDSLGDKQQALKFYNQSLPLTIEVGDKSQQATTLNNIGSVYHSLGDKQQALKFYNQSLPLSIQVGDKSGQATTLGNLAGLERKQGNLSASRKQIESAINIIEELRGTYTDQNLKATYFATVQGYYKFYIDLLMELDKKNPGKNYDALALNISEKSRARVLLELLTEANAKIRKGAKPELLQKESDLLQQIDAKEALLQKQKSGNQKDALIAESIKKLETDLENLRNQYQQLQTTIRESSPRYANLKYPQPLNLQQIQQQLDKDTVLLQYSIGSDRSYLWAVTPNSLNTYQLPGKKVIDLEAGKFRTGISSATEVPPEVIQSANKLSKILLVPVADKIKGKRLVIVADGALQTIPFAALPDINSNAHSNIVRANSNIVRANSRSPLRITGIKTENRDFYSQTNSKYQPLMVNHEIVNLPSASAIAIQRQELANRKPAPKQLAILADPVYSATDTRVTGKPENTQLGTELQIERSALARSAKNLQRSGWERLPNTAIEAKAILNLVNSFTKSPNSIQAFNFDANFDWVTNPALNQFRILHFATHGFADTTNPENSGIVLSQFDKQGKPIRGFLRLGDLFNQDYPAELIVLSACQTGLGKEVNGEGLVGLTRGLMYAGAERVAVSLWNVNDKGTSVLMQEFYTEMLQGNKTPAAAMRAAQIKLWSNPEWRNPYYWAAFTVSGEWR
jgi:CHAT domain-containing protein/tetratricopeptide (TPR) repeat protein